MPPITEQDIQQARLMLKDGEHTDEIVAALNLLGKWKSVEAVPDMMAYIDDTRPPIVAALQDALLELGQDAIPAIVDYLPKLAPEKQINLQSLVERFWKEGDVAEIHRMMNHEDNRVRWAMAWTMSKPLRTIPPEEIAYIFEGLGDESVTAIRWAATQSLTTLAHNSTSIPPELIRIALPVMVDNFKYGDENLSEASVQAIALLISPPHPAINAMLTSPDALLQVAAVKVLATWVEKGSEPDDETMNALTEALKTPSWQMANEIAHLRYVLDLTFPDTVEKLETPSDTIGFEDERIDPTESKRPSGEIMLPSALADANPINPIEGIDMPSNASEVDFDILEAIGDIHLAIDDLFLPIEPDTATSDDNVLPPLDFDTDSDDSDPKD